MSSYAVSMRVFSTFNEKANSVNNLLEVNLFAFNLNRNKLMNIYIKHYCVTKYMKIK